MSELYKIGQVAELCDISIKTLRFYEDEKLIKPAKVDIYTGYRFYDDKSLVQIYRVKFLRELGFSIKEIREFNEHSISDKMSEIEMQICRLKDNREMLSFLNKQKGEKYMKNFVNDKNALGKWKYIANTTSKEDYLKGKFTVDKDPDYKNLYFLPNGQGYWIFDRWTKGMILHYRGDVMPYSIEGNKLFLDYVNDGQKRFTIVFERVDNKEYSKEEIAIVDDINLPFVLDKKALGFWQAVDCVDFEDKKSYKPRENADTDLFLKSLTFNPNGDVIFEANSLLKLKWTKGKVINQYQKNVMDYRIKTFDGQAYMIMDWKSGDYTYNGDIECCYVFKKI